MKTYPGIYRDENGAVRLYLNENAFFSFKRDQWEKDECKYGHEKDVNITAEYLTNTYGNVENKEHAEFIKLLANNEDIKCNFMVCNDDIRYFYFSGGVLFFTFSSIDDSRFKKVTIPLPPKEKEESMSEKIKVNVVNSTKATVQVKKDDESKVVNVFINDLSNNGDNLLFGGEDKCKEWPAVGDDVLYDGSSERLKEIKGEIVKVIGKYSFDADDYITVKHNEHGVFAMRLGSWIKKPPAPEEELRDELISAMDNSNTAFQYAEYLSKAIINGEIEGLSYKPQ